jgi:hypothetical protein
MKALTLWQPWSWAIAHAGKRIENREWQPPRSIIGQRIAIHAGKTLDDNARKWIADETMVEPPMRGGYVIGAIESVATIVGAIAINGNMVQRIGPLTSEQICEAADSVWFVGPIGWVLAGVTVLPHSIPCRGAQKLWDLPPDVERQVIEQVRP